MPDNKITKFNFDIAVIGTGALARSAANLLATVAHTCLISEPNKTEINITVPWPNIIWPNPTDMITRLAVAHGWEMACYLNDLCTIQNQIPCYRLVQYELEHLEILGSKSKHLTRHSSDSNWYHDSFVAMATQLPCDTKIFANSVLQLQESAKNGVELMLSHNTKIRCEIVILCCEDTIGTLISSLSDVCIGVPSFCDIWRILPSQPMAFRTANSQFSGCVYQANGNTYLQTAGPKYLAQNTGQAVLDLVSRFWDSNIAQYTSQLGMQIGRLNHHIQHTTTQQCLPCDELPLIGDIGTTGRLLCATGFAGYEDSVAPKVAQILYQLAMTGKSNLLHSRLHPSRFVNLN